MGSKTIVFRANVYVTSEAAINISLYSCAYSLGSDQPKYGAPEIWNQNSGPPGQNFDSKFTRIFETPAKIFKTRAKIFKTPAKIFKTLAKILDCSPQCSIPEPIRLGSKTIVFLVNVYVTSEAAINLSMGQRGNPRFIFLCPFPRQRST